MRRFHFRAGILAGLMLLLACAPAMATLQDCMAATCRVTSPDNTRGTGCVFQRSQGYVYVLTNAHVATASTAQCEFWRDGHQLPAVQAILVSRHPAPDAAVLAIPEAGFGGQPPPAIPLAPLGTTLSPGQTVASVGCPEGGWPTAWLGHIVRQDGSSVYFVPTPAGGRSGSAVFNAGGDVIVALLHSRLTDNSAGIATPSESVRPSVYAARTSDTLHAVVFSNKYGPLVDVQCPGGTCPPRNYLLPYRYRNQPQQPNAPQPQQPYIPPQQYTPPAPLPPSPIAPNYPVPPASSPNIVIDISPIGDALGPMGEYYQLLIEEKKSAQNQEIIEGGTDVVIGVGREVAEGDWQGVWGVLGNAGSVEWLASMIVLGVGLIFGVKWTYGLSGAAMRFGVRYALRTMFGYLASDSHTEADDVVDEVAKRAADKVAHGTAVTTNGT